MAARRRADFCIVLTTCASARVERSVIGALLLRRLAACIQVVPARSHYVWKGRPARARESLMLIKARTADFARVRNVILGLHDYEVPEVLRVRISGGSARYLDWMRAATGRRRSAG
jgi:periplasmic divalent cation tolerance protein